MFLALIAAQIALLIWVPFTGPRHAGDIAYMGPILELLIVSIISFFVFALGLEMVVQFFKSRRWWLVA